MDRSYKIILIVSFLMTVILSVLVYNNTTVWKAVFYTGAIMFVFFSGVYSFLYYALHKNRHIHMPILVMAIIITAFLFTMDYVVWDNDPPNPSVKQVVFESAVYGTGYVFLLWCALALLFWTANAVVWFIKKLILK